MSVTINVGSPLNNHFVVVNGLVGDKVCYVDPWNGQNKETSLKNFIGLMRDSDLSGIHGVSYQLLNDIASWEKEIGLLVEVGSPRDERLEPLNLG